MFKKYTYGRYRKEIRGLLRKRLATKERITYHQKKITHHNGKIEEIKKELLGIEREIDSYLEKAGNELKRDD